MWVTHKRKASVVSLEPQTEAIFISAHNSPDKSKQMFLVRQLEGCRARILVPLGDPAAYLSV